MRSTQSATFLAHSTHFLLGHTSSQQQNSTAATSSRTTSPRNSTRKRPQSSHARSRPTTCKHGDFVYIGKHAETRRFLTRRRLGNKNWRTESIFLPIFLFFVLIKRHVHLLPILLWRICIFLSCPCFRFCPYGFCVFGCKMKRQTFLRLSKLKTFVLHFQPH